MADNLFKYNDGKSDLYADSFEVDYRFDKAVMDTGADLDLINQWITDVPRTEDGSVDAEKFTQGQQRLYVEACHRYVPLIRTAFDLKPFDPKTGEGLGSELVLRLWANYIRWKADVKKNTEPPPPSVIPTEASVPNTSGVLSGQSSLTEVFRPKQSMVSIST